MTSTVTSASESPSHTQGVGEELGDTEELGGADGK